MKSKKQMKLSRKNFLYSLILGGILLALIIGYFVLMLPSLYVDYVSDSNLNAIKKQHIAYLQQHNYDDVSVTLSPACFTVEIPFSDNTVYFTNLGIRAKIETKDDTTTEVLQDAKDILRQLKDNSSLLRDDEYSHMLKDRFAKWKEQLSEYKDLTDDLPIDITMLQSNDYSDIYSGETSTIHIVSDDVAIIEGGINDRNNSYTNYLALTVTDDSLVVSYQPVMTPKMNEILPVVLQSIPMIVAVLLLLVLIFSQVYSRGIVTPIVRLVQHTKDIRKTGIQYASVPEIRGCDEVTVLADTLNDLYQELKNSYEQLEEKNLALQEENERKEVFLRASSHQLKTPIAAALLLVDGMMNQIGKYKDTSAYLPEVKKQLLSMKNMVQDILYLNHCTENLTMTELDLSNVIDTILPAHEIAFAQKQITVQNSVNSSQTDLIVHTDFGLISKIIDNLLSNAVNYTPEGGRIHIEATNNSLRITNYGGTIAPELLPHIFEPFVTGNKEQRCHGLGLYIVSYYAKMLNCKVSIINVEHGVRAEITFSE